MEVEMYFNSNSLFFGRSRMLALLLVSFLVFAAGGCNKPVAEQNTNTGNEHNIAFQIPTSIKAEHEELHHELENAIKSGGRTGEAAKVVADRLNLHFEKEEEYALPPLGLLSSIADGKASAEMKKAISLTDKLKAEMPQMLSEHKAIVVALDGLASAAKAENKPDAVAFTEKLKMHAQNEEQILYPAAILVGEYLKLRFK